MAEGCILQPFELEVKERGQHLDVQSKTTLIQVLSILPLGGELLLLHRHALLAAWPSEAEQRSNTHTL